MCWLGGDSAKMQTRTEKGGPGGPAGGERSGLIRTAVQQRGPLSRGPNEAREGALRESVPHRGDRQGKGPEASGAEGEERAGHDLRGEGTVVRTWFLL